MQSSDATNMFEELPEDVLKRIDEVYAERTELLASRHVYSAAVDAVQTNHGYDFKMIAEISSEHKAPQDNMLLFNTRFSVDVIVSTFETAKDYDDGENNLNFYNSVDKKTIELYYSIYNKKNGKKRIMAIMSRCPSKNQIMSLAILKTTLFDKKIIVPEEKIDELKSLRVEHNDFDEFLTVNNVEIISCAELNLEQLSNTFKGLSINLDCGITLFKHFQLTNQLFDKMVLGVRVGTGLPTGSHVGRLTDSNYLDKNYSIKHVSGLENPISWKGARWLFFTLVRVQEGLPKSTLQIDKVIQSIK